MLKRIPENWRLKSGGKGQAKSRYIWIPRLFVTPGVGMHSEAPVGRLGAQVGAARRARLD